MPMEYAAERIIATRAVPGKGGGSGRWAREYRVRWVGYSASEDTWEPAEHILDPLLWREWEREQGGGVGIDGGGDEWVRCL